MRADRHSKKTYIVLEIDKNGTILLRNLSGKERRYSEKYISSTRKIIKYMSSEDAHDLGYRVGLRIGLSVKKSIHARKSKDSEYLPNIIYGLPTSSCIILNFPASLAQVNKKDN